MTISLREDAKYALITPTSMGVRLTPHNGQPFQASTEFTMTATSAESNVGSVSSYLGLPVKVLTNFVADSPISAFIKSNLLARRMHFEGPEVPQGDAWGFRHQFNLADSGFGSRGPRVHNDRSGEVGRTLNVKDFDLDRIFGDEGSKIVHLSGLIGALSKETSQFCLDIARVAKSMDRESRSTSITVLHFGKDANRNSGRSLLRSHHCQIFLSETKKTFSFALVSKDQRKAAKTSPERSKTSNR